MFKLSFRNSRPADHFIGHITFFYLAKLLLMKAVTNALPPFMQQSSFQGKGSFGQRYVVQKMHITSTFIGATGASSINKV